VGAAEWDHRDALGREVAAAAGGERLEHDPVALALDEDDGLHGHLLNAALLGKLATRDHHAMVRLAQVTLSRRRPGELSICPIKRTLLRLLRDGQLPQQIIGHALHLFGRHNAGHEPRASAPRLHTLVSQFRPRLPEGNQ
jgi:hypothetical protein